MTRRRDFLAGAASVLGTAALPRVAAAVAPDADAAARAALDGVAALATPAAKLAKLRDVREHGLSPRTKLDLETAREGLAIDARIAEIMPYGRLGRSPYSVTPTSGAWRDLDVSDAVDRIAADTAAVKREAAAGIVLPPDPLDRTVGAILGAAGRTSGPVSAALGEQARLLVSLASRADEPGMSHLPNGTAYYELMIDRQFGGRDAAAIHRRVMALATETAAEADDLLRRFGYAGRHTGERFRSAFRDPQFLYPDSDDGRDRAVADMNSWLVRTKERLPGLFGSLPPECMNVAVGRMTPVEESAKKGGYRVLPNPNGTPGRYFVDLSDIRRRPNWSLPSVVHHELLPGHMVQMPIDARAAPHALRVEYTAGFQEGWAIYAEQLMAPLGTFEADDRARLGFLHWMLFRLCRSLIDTGVHSARWSLQEARETLERMQGEPAFFATFDQDIQRVCLEPGARVGEALAWLALADRCGPVGAADLSARHRAAIGDGRIRLSALQRRLGPARPWNSIDRQ
ncbi:MAG: DUF885 family protein [Sphingomonas sp.]|uniref:DUF885 family protein n=1 Tax=Sphingomonas sp. TaxID=28214 RepID=UPI001AD039E6|nr:DUF885 family protein [Sphingomonas sp.]MBN8814390.1 DUF885 family protein [Sphingomonas sp.]